MRLRPISPLALALLAAAGFTGTATLATDTSPAQALTVTHTARSLQPGELVVLTIESETALSSIEVKAFGRTERVQALPPTADRPHAWMALVPIDLNVKPGVHRVSVTGSGSAGRASATHSLAISDKTFETRHLTVSPAFVNPPASVTDRITREAIVLNAIYEGSAGPSPARDLNFVAPVPHEANSAFGKRSVFNGQPRSPHGGADFMSPQGTPIKAPAPGKVMLADDLYYTGGSVVIDHGLGVISVFAHLSQIDAQEGTDVARGDVLGLVGATGRVTGAHLHWTVRVNDIRVDPLSLVAILSGH